MVSLPASPARTFTVFGEYLAGGQAKKKAACASDAPNACGLVVEVVGTRDTGPQGQGLRQHHRVWVSPLCMVGAPSVLRGV